IGPEVTSATVKIIDASGVKINWDHVEAGGAIAVQHGTPLPEYVFTSIIRNGVALKGPITTPIGQGFTSVNVALRKKLNLYASLRPAKSIPALKTRYEDIDLVVVRENTEDLYAGLEHIVVPGVVESLKIITEKASTAIARFAFEYAKNNDRQLIT